MIRYKCKRCASKLETTDSLGGQTETCPVCQHVNSVPTCKSLEMKTKKGRKVQEEMIVQERQKIVRPEPLKKTHDSLNGKKSESALFSNQVGIIGGCILFAFGVLCICASNESSGLHILGCVLVLAPVVAAIFGIPGSIAKSRHCMNKAGINVLGYCGLFVLPLWVAALIWACTGSVREEQREIASGRLECPRCGESIPVAAKICRFCAYELTSLNS